MKNRSNRNKQTTGDKHNPYPIPVRLNLAIFAGLVIVLPLLLIAGGRTDDPFALLGLALVYGVLMNTNYSVFHEATHDVFHPDPRLNHLAGTVMMLFFPASYELFRQGHLGHHLRNRSDDEAFDYYRAEEGPWMRRFQLYALVTGLHYFLMIFAHLLALFLPVLIKTNLGRGDRAFAALIRSLNVEYARIIQVEMTAALLFQAGLILVFELKPLNHLAMCFSFGFMWSAQQYVHHFGANRHVLHGAWNLKTWWWLDRLHLFHNWHYNHHTRPSVPWLYLPRITADPEAPRRGLIRHYLSMWRGPRLTEERVANKYADRIIPGSSKRWPADRSA